MKATINNSLAVSRCIGLAGVGLRFRNVQTSEYRIGYKGFLVQVRGRNWSRTTSKRFSRTGDHARPSLRTTYVLSPHNIGLEAADRGQDFTLFFVRNFELV